MYIQITHFPIVLLTLSSYTYGSYVWPASAECTYYETNSTWTDWFTSIKPWIWSRVLHEYLFVLVAYSHCVFNTLSKFWEWNFLKWWRLCKTRAIFLIILLLVWSLPKLSFLPDHFYHMQLYGMVYASHGLSLPLCSMLASLTLRRLNSCFQILFELSS